MNDFTSSIYSDVITLVSTNGTPSDSSAKDGLYVKAKVTSPQQAVLFKPG